MGREPRHTRLLYFHSSRLRPLRRRPIGIFPTSIGMWFRLRAPHVRSLERAHERALFEAGQGRGADAAVWLQAPYMEGACMAKRSLAAALRDLVKAFDHVSHSALAIAAMRWNFLLWFLLMGVAAHQRAFI